MRKAIRWILEIMSMGVVTAMTLVTDGITAGVCAGVIAIIIFVLYKVIKGEQNSYPLSIVGYFYRTLDAENKSKSMELDYDEHLTNTIGELMEFPNRNLLITGVSGNSGKSSIAEALLYDITNPVMCVRYGLDKPMKAVVFSPKKFADEDVPDFAVCGLRIVDCSKEMPSPFDRNSFVDSWQVLVANSIDNQGITASQIAETAGHILDAGKCESWKDFRKNLAVVRKQRDEMISQSQMTWIENKVQYLDVGAEIVGDIPTSDVIYYLGNLPSRARAFYYESFLQTLVKELEQGNGGVRPLLVLDESHIIFKHQHSIIARYMRELRTHVSGIWSITQNKEDINPSLLQFSKILCGTTQSLDDYISKPVIKDCVSALQPRQFVDWTFTGTDAVPVYGLNKKYVELLGNLKQEWKARQEVVSSTVQEEGLGVATPSEAVVEQRKEITDDDIIRVVNDSEYCSTVSSVGKALGLTRGEQNTTNLSRKLARLVKEGKIRLKLYVTATLGKDDKPRKYYFSAENKGESQLHRTLLRDTETALIKAGVPYKVGMMNQGSDFICNGFEIEAETSLKRELQSYDVKCNESAVLIITVVANRQDAERYSYLPSANNEKQRILLLNELGGFLLERKKIGTT